MGLPMMLGMKRKIFSSRSRDVEGRAGSFAIPLEAGLVEVIVAEDVAQRPAYFAVILGSQRRWLYDEERGASVSPSVAWRKLGKIRCSDFGDQGAKCTDQDREQANG